MSGVGRWDALIGAWLDSIDGEGTDLSETASIDVGIDALRALLDRAAADHDAAVAAARDAAFNDGLLAAERDCTAHGNYMQGARIAALRRPEPAKGGAT